MTQRPVVEVLSKADAVAAGAARSMPGCAQRWPRARLTFTGTRCFNLDEYRGLSPDHPRSYHRYMALEFFEHVDILAGNWRLPDGEAEARAASAAYERVIRAAGGIGLQLLGLGENSHIGFNEPEAPFDSRTRVVALAPSTIAANASGFPPGEEPPRQAITMGIGTILEARRILLLATGEHKAQALAAALDGPVSPQVPASALRLHPDVTILCDTAACSELPSRLYGSGR